VSNPIAASIQMPQTEDGSTDKNERVKGRNWNWNWNVNWRRKDKLRRKSREDQKVVVRDFFLSFFSSPLSSFSPLERSRSVAGIAF
jgi:hypothetical protein